ncbi:hypothetical protein [Metaclostridioides mangenotii]|uniref:Polymerase nucleotidyl transferase domain-containing protein n=1 Tax=Metaclostridioides mangenotii TaxID=1540 RepID=A0ABS4E8T9_9FIRM|nr:hypothetical protein [Clostridioides mangenotii]MBP1854344.1 hypothetical protein [Clostridioides mangenotii]
MRDNIYSKYIDEVNKIKQNSGVYAIFLVGSSKAIDLKKVGQSVNDIDIFVICDSEEKQVRVIKDIDGLSFDINYFSKKYCDEMIEKREIFFINEMVDAKVAYDSMNISKDLIKSCKDSFAKGPKKLIASEKDYIKQELYTNLLKLADKQKYNEIEYHFLTNLFLKDIIIGYFSINDIWLPKEKKLLKALHKENRELYILFENAYRTKDYIDLNKIYIYVFRDVDIKKYIKLIY